MDQSIPGTSTELGGKIQNKLADSRFKFRENVYQKSPLSSPIRFISWGANQLQDTPNGWIDFNRAGSHQTLNQYLRKVPNMDKEKRLSLVADYMAATNENAKIAVIQKAENAATRAVASRYNLTAAEADKIQGWHQNRRGQAVTSVKDRRAYSGTTMEDGTPVDVFNAVDDDLAAIHSPILETQLANKMPLLDIEQLDKILWRNKSKIAVLKHQGQDLNRTNLDEAGTEFREVAGMTKDVTVALADSLN